MPKHLEQVSRWLSRWKPRLLLDKWAVIPKIVTTDPPLKDGMLDMAAISVDTVNSESRMEIYPRLWEESRDYQEITIIHEMAHIHTEPIRQLLDKAVRAGTVDRKEATNRIEDLTNSIAKIVYVAYRRSKKNKMEFHL